MKEMRFVGYSILLIIVLAFGVSLATADTEEITNKGDNNTFEVKTTRQIPAREDITIDEYTFENIITYISDMEIAKDRLIAEKALSNDRYDSEISILHERLIKVNAILFAAEQKGIKAKVKKVEAEVIEVVDGDIIDVFIEEVIE